MIILRKSRASLTLFNPFKKNSNFYFDLGIGIKNVINPPEGVRLEVYLGFACLSILIWGNSFKMTYTAFKGSQCCDVDGNKT